MKLSRQPLPAAAVALMVCASALLIALAGMPVDAAASTRSAASPGTTGISTISVGSDPDGTAVDAATGMVYITNAGSNSVSVIDGATGAVTATIPVGSEPAGIAVDNDTDMIYVANHGAPTVSVIDGATNTVTATLTVSTAGGPDAIAVDPATDKIFVTTADWIAEIDGATDQVTPDWFMVTGAGISDSMALDPANGKLYLLNFWTDDQVLIIDTATATQTGHFEGGAGADALAVDPVSNLLYVANCDPGYGNGVWIFNLTSGSIQAEAADSCPTAVGSDSANGTGVAVDQSTGATSVISPSGAVVGTLTAATASDEAGPTDAATGIVSVYANTIYIADQTSDGTVTAITQTAPTITSAPAASFTAGKHGTYHITATGIPQHMTFSAQGHIAKGLRLSPAGVLSGTPAVGAGGTYKLTVTATNSIKPSATQHFTLTVRQQPAFISAATTRFRTGKHHTFRITTSGYPAPRLTERGQLPKGLSLKIYRNGTATLTGTPRRSDKQRTYILKLTATNATGKTATQTFRLRLN
ncbi:MAG TPA: putative Ig domain-containing protein [Streptosporangiaceae bacterium]|nr:putative Ig domain-containing protein [Streptosporangiaceae bacterium]